MRRAAASVTLDPIPTCDKQVIVNTLPASRVKNNLYRLLKTQF